MAIVHIVYIVCVVCVVRMAHVSSPPACIVTLCLYRANRVLFAWLLLLRARMHVYETSSVPPTQQLTMLTEI